MKEKQFVHDFKIQGNQLVCKVTNEIFKPEGIVIERVFVSEYSPVRYPGDFN